MSPHYNHEHLIHRIGWLRAATLGANDGIISISSLLVGMASSGAQWSVVMTSGVAGLVAGAASMAAGEWVSVMSQSDAEEAELALEIKHIENNPQQELMELQKIYEGRGLKPDLARQVAVALTEHDVVESHARDELGITEHSKAKPAQAALASALTFLSGGVVPLLLMWLTQTLQFDLTTTLWAMGLGSVFTLFVTGALVARASNAHVWRSAFRVAIWGTFSMAASALLGRALGVHMA
ncbi:VIT family protein [Limnobacter humi]|uniref:VIT family protein n=1 Tax=Limnobacter humi TaxID=1778671 RepID=A0ABT1WFX6_9BURK|nr:VIT family protein [Limnobacter humi]MCQ8895808.1 VIT family protein [Limnobacter humi]